MLSIYWYFSLSKISCNPMLMQVQIMIVRQGRAGGHPELDALERCLHLARNVSFRPWLTWGGQDVSSDQVGVMITVIRWDPPRPLISWHCRRREDSAVQMYTSSCIVVSICTLADEQDLLCSFVTFNGGSGWVWKKTI